MAPPPPKRQKRRPIISSEDEDADISEKYRTSSLVADGVLPKNHVRLANSDATLNRSLPQRSRTKSNTTPKSRSATPVTSASPNSSFEDPPRRYKHEKKGPLHAYFNAGNRIQQHEKEVQPKVETPVRDAEEEDLIEDDSLDEELQHSSFAQSAPTSTTIPPRGLPVPRIDQSFSADSDKLPGGSQRFLRASRATGKDAATQATSTNKEVDLRPWAERYAPTGLEELMVHKKKVADVRLWLERAFLGRERKRLLILRGPSGAGKTATISTLAKVEDFDITQWKNPMNSEYSSEGYVSVSAQFEDFLGRSGKFGSLTFARDRTSADVAPQMPSNSVPRSAKNKVILLEEFPNTFTSASIALQSFRSTVLQHLAAHSPSNANIPIILIITETQQTAATAAKDSFTAHRLLGPDILTHPSTTIIEFNPVAASLLKKALDIVIHKEARHSGRRRVPGPSVLKKLGEVGDVRSAIGSLEFLCLRAEDGDDWGGRVASKGKKSVSPLTRMEMESMEMVTQREASLGIFHAVGKVVYNKRGEPAAASSTLQTAQHLRRCSQSMMVSQVSVEDLLSETGTDISTFIAALHENYILSCESPFFTDSFNGCIDALSDSDLLGLDKDFGFTGSGRSSESLKNDEIAFHVAVRGLLFALPYPVKRRAPDGGHGGRNGGRVDAFKMFWPTSMRIARRKEEVEALIDTWYQRRGIFLSLKENPETESPQDQRHTEPFRIGISSTKDELILERLPYIPKISPDNKSEMERITKLSGDEKAADDVLNEDIEQSGTSFAKKRAGRGGRGGVRNKEGIGDELAGGVEMGQLWLSDDDIEDG